MGGPPFCRNDAELALRPVSVCSSVLCHTVKRTEKSASN